MFIFEYSGLGITNESQTCDFINYASEAASALDRLATLRSGEGNAPAMARWPDRPRSARRAQLRRASFRILQRAAERVGLAGDGGRRRGGLLVRGRRADDRHFVRARVVVHVARLARSPGWPTWPFAKMPMAGHPRNINDIAK